MENAIKIASLLRRIAASPGALNDLVEQAATGLQGMAQRPLERRGMSDFGEEMGKKLNDASSTLMAPLTIPHHLKHVVTGNPDPKKSRLGHAYYAGKGGLTGYGGYALVDRTAPKVREITEAEDTPHAAKIKALARLFG